MKEKNPTLEKYKKQYAISKGFKSWNDMRAVTRLQDMFRYLHEVCEVILDDK